MLHNVGSPVFRLLSFTQPFAELMIGF